MRSLLLAEALVAGLLPLGAVAAQPEAEPAPAEAPQSPPAPMTDAFDWMQFRNGEWLKGEIIDLQDDEFVFESDELDTQELDWEDIETLYLPGRNTLMFRDKTVVEGSVRIDGETVTVTTADGEVRTFPRSALRSIIPGRQTELNFWSGKLSLGTTVRSGNTDQTDIAGFFEIERRDLDSRLTIRYDGNYSTLDGAVVANSHRGLANYNIYVSERFFLTPARLEAFRDTIQNIEYQLTPGVGAGYDIIDTGDLEWTVGAGAGWQFTRYDDPEPGDSATDDTAALLFSTNVDWEATSDLDLGFEFDMTMPVPSTQSYNLRAALTSELELWSDFDLDMQLIWNRINDPASSGGETPEKDDYRLYVGLGWEF